MWPSSRFTHTGWSGVTASIQSRARQLAAPELMVPVAAGDPGAGRHRLRERPDARDELVARLRVAQLHRGQALAAVEEVHVRVDEAGYEELSAGVDHGAHRAGEASDLVGAADGGNPVARDRDGLGLGPVAVASPHTGVDGSPS